MAADPTEIFGILRQARRVWAVGAIHGEVARLRKLHDVLEHRFQLGDRLIYLGNHLGRGGAIRETVDEMLSFRRSLMARFLLCGDDIVFLRGSQEEMWHKLLQLHLAREPAQVLEWMLAHGVDATLEAYGQTAQLARQRCREGAWAMARWTSTLRDAVRENPGHDELSTVLRRAAVTESGMLLFVHAGIDVARPLAAQTDSFWWGRGDFASIDQPYETFRRIVRGYDPSHGGVVVGDITATVDAGCGFEGGLSAVCFDANGAAEDRIDV